jgi:hypothetical protein
MGKPLRVVIGNVSNRQHSPLARHILPSTGQNMPTINSLFIKTPQHDPLMHRIGAELANILFAIAKRVDGVRMPGRIPIGDGA